MDNINPEIIQYLEFKISEVIKYLEFEPITDPGHATFKAGDILKHEDGHYELVGTINENGGYTDGFAEPKYRYKEIAKNAFKQLIQSIEKPVILKCFRNQVFGKAKYESLDNAMRAAFWQVEDNEGWPDSITDGNKTYFRDDMERYWAERNWSWREH
jgi:hypothetical protein